MVLRAGAPLVTVGGATVLDPEPPIAGVRKETSIGRFQQLDAPYVPIELILQERGELGLGVRELVRRWGLDVPAAQTLIEELVQTGRAVRVGDRVVAMDLIQRWEARALEAIAAFHRAHPLDAGLSSGAIRDRGARHVSEAFIAVVLGRLAAKGETRGTDRISLASHTPTASAESSWFRNRLNAPSSGVR